MRKERIKMNDYDYEYSQSYVDDVSFANDVYEDKSIALNKAIYQSFGFMFAALLITAFAAFTTRPENAIRILAGGKYIVLLLAELAVVFISNIAIKKNNVVLAGIMYTIYSYLTGYICSVLFVLYSATSIGYTFIACAATFGVMAVIGLTTKRELNTLGSYCIMGLVGIIIASAVNIIFIHSWGFDFIVTIVAILVFVGLTAYDVRKTKEYVMYANENELVGVSMFCGFQLYLDFINLFLRLLRILGGSKGSRK